MPDRPRRLLRLAKPSAVSNQSPCGRCSAVVSLLRNVAWKGPLRRVAGLPAALRMRIVRCGHFTVGTHLAASLDPFVAGSAGQTLSSSTPGPAQREALRRPQRINASVPPRRGKVGRREGRFPVVRSLKMLRNTEVQDRCARKAAMACVRQGPWPTGHCDRLQGFRVFVQKPRHRRPSHIGVRILRHRKDSARIAALRASAPPLAPEQTLVVVIENGRLHDSIPPDFASFSLRLSGGNCGPN